MKGPATYYRRLLLSLAALITAGAAFWYYELPAGYAWAMLAGTLLSIVLHARLWFHAVFTPDWKRSRR